jgi:hypothetical protein
VIGSGIQRELYLEWAEDKKKLFRLLGNIGIQKRPNKKQQKMYLNKNTQEFV